MPASWQTHRLPKKHSDSKQDDIPLSELRASPPLQDQVDNGGGQRPVSTRWRSLCYSLHAFLIVIHLILLGVAASHHAERRVVIVYDIDVLATGLSIGLQAFYILYTAVLVFVTQKLILSSIFSHPKKLTQIHDICGAWAGLGAALSALWQQTKVASSALSIVLVTVYFACVAVLHVTSSILVQLQLFNDTTTSVVPALGTWPNASVSLTSLDWATVTAPIPFLQDMYGNTTDGLANNTLYDIPLSGFINATVPATTVNANCGLLTNLSIAGPNASASAAAIQNGITWNVTASMPALGPVTILIWFPPFLSEVWFSPDVQCFQPICSTLILYLVTAEMEVDDSLDGVSHVYINGTYSPAGGITQNFSTPIYLIACSLNSTNHTVTLNSSGIQLNSGVQPTDAVWSAFSLSGDPNLTSGISSAMASANSLAGSPGYCQPLMSLSSPTPWTSITAFNAYIGSLLGMGASSCNGVSLPARYTSTPPLLTKYQVESAVSQTAAEFIWLAGELGEAGGGFDRQTEEAVILPPTLQWRLNINALPVIFALCASIIIFIPVFCALWGHNPAAVSSAGVLEMMWFGSRSQVLRKHLREVQTPCLDSLRAASMFETVFWTPSPNKYEGSSGLYGSVPLHNLETHASGSRSLGFSGSETETPCSSDVSRDNVVHRPNTSRSHRWCYALHIVLVALHVALLALLVHHPEQSVVIPSETSTLTVGLSAFLQGFYTLYTAVLVLLMQRLALAMIVSGRQKLTTVHDVSGAWTGIGAAIYMLWRQRKASSSTWAVVGVGAYLTLMLILHITSSSIMQWQAFNSTLTGVIQTNLALPDGAVNISQLSAPDIFPIVQSIGQDSTLTTHGLWNATLYDVVQNPGNISFAFATVNATTLTAQCGLVPNLTLSNQTSNGEYQISFQNGTNSGTFLEEPAIWKDVVHAIPPSTQVQCMGCPQTLFYMLTTIVNVDESVDESVSLGLNWTYTPPGGNPQNSTSVTYIAACSINAQTVPAVLDTQLDVLETAPDQTTVGPVTSSWSVWSPGNATNLSVGIATMLRLSPTISYQVNSVLFYTNVDMYIMSLLGLNLSYAIATGGSQSSADPTVALSPWQLENAIAQTAAKFLWIAGQVGDIGGGFQRSVGESQAMSNVVQFRLHLNTVPVIVASIAAFFALVLAMLIIGKSSGKRVGLVSGTSVLECLWFEAHSESIHAHMETINGPDLDRLRAVGMFDVCLGDIGRSPYPETEQPILESHLAVRLPGNGVTESCVGGCNDSRITAVSKPSRRL